MLMHCIIVGNIIGLLFITDGFSSIICCYPNLDLEFTYRNFRDFISTTMNWHVSLLNEDVENV